MAHEAMLQLITILQAIIDNLVLTEQSSSIFVSNEPLLDRIAREQIKSRSINLVLRNTWSPIHQHNLKTESYKQFVVHDYKLNPYDTSMFIHSIHSTCISPNSLLDRLVGTKIRGLLVFSIYRI